MIIRLADYIVQKFVEHGIRKVFLVTGGGSMHLNDAFKRNPDMDVICFHHEQSAAMAAESYYRLTNKLCVVNVTTGPGGINALNGVYGGYVDSIGMIVVSGQVKYETYKGAYPASSIRQLGDQEVDIVSMANPITKLAATISSVDNMNTIIKGCIDLASSGRPGPVWLDIPLDIQARNIDTTVIKPYSDKFWNHFVILYGNRNSRQELNPNRKNGDYSVNSIIDRLKLAKRPVLFVGSGVRLSGMADEFLTMTDTLKIPVITGWNAHDILTNDNFCYVGRAGTVGDRAGNFVVQNSDFLLILGSRLNIRQVSYNWKNFAPNAYKIMVDIDEEELYKPSLDIDYKICANLNKFIPDLNQALSEYVIPETHKEYLCWCRGLVEKYPVIVPKFIHKTNCLNPYLFVDEFINNLPNDAIIITGNGSACVIGFQVAKLKRGQRLYTNSGAASMGYDLPAAIGASIAGDNCIVYCLTGDGSIMMNLQELETIVNYQLPVKIVILNNGGYSSINQTQRNYFPDNVFGTGPDNGVSFPNFVKIGTAFGIKSYSIKNIRSWHNTEVQADLYSDIPVLYNVFVDPKQPFEPKLAAQKLSDGSLLAPSLENMYPFLTDDELGENIL